MLYKNRKQIVAIPIEVEGSVMSMSIAYVNKIIARVSTAVQSPISRQAGECSAPGKVLFPSARGWLGQAPHWGKSHFGEADEHSNVVSLL